MNTFHLCKNGQQRPGHREDCPKCSPHASKTNQIIVQQTARNAELKAALQRMVTQFEGAAETQDDLNALAEARKALQ